MGKKSAIFLTAILTVALLSACGASDGSGTSGSTGSAGGSVSAGSGKEEITWTWGTFRGLYGDAEVTFNEDGGRESILLKYPNGRVYRQIEYSYNNNFSGNADIAVEESFLSGKKVYPISKVTKDAGGNLLYSYGYEWSPCEMKINYWGAGIASDITPILEASGALEAGKTPEEPEERYYSSYEYGYDYESGESCGYVNYQELSHLTLGGQYQLTYKRGNGYWLTERVNGNPAKTWFYSVDGRLDENITITWNYEKNQPVSLQLGQYGMDTYLAEVSDDGLTVTYTLDESHSAEGTTAEGEKAETKDLEQVYAFALTRQEDGNPAMFRYGSSKEYLNTDSAQTEEYTITYHYENGVLSGAEYEIKENGSDSVPYAITCNEEGMLETEDHLKSGIGKGDIGAKAYTYHDNGMVASITGYGYFTTEDPEQISYVHYYSEEGRFCGEAFYRKGMPYVEYTYFENGEKSGMTSYDDGRVDSSCTYNEKGVYASYVAYNDDGSVRRKGEMTGENEFTMYEYKQDADNTEYVSAVYVYGEESFEGTSYNEDGSVRTTSTYQYNGKNYQ